MSPLLTEGLTLTRAGESSGERIVPSDSPLTRLNYFDGKFLRADDLQREQLYLRRLVQLGNQGLGAGVVYGLTLSLTTQGKLALGAGLAIDSAGRPLLLPSAATLDVARLLDASARLATASRLTAGAAFGGCVDATESDAPTTPLGSALYVICASHAESLCGTEDVYGRLCEEACVTATDRPYVVEGVLVRALPLTLRTPMATSKLVTLDRRHLRSLVASAYFADERLAVGSLVSGAGLRAGTWCAGAEAAGGSCVPLGVLARAGATTPFVDMWTSRRERIEAPARRYWAWRMAMRPWDAFLAHVLQFQCQLHEVLGAAPDDGGSDDPCAGSGKLLGEASRYLRGVDESYARQVDLLSRPNEAPRAATFALDGGLAELTRLRARLDGAIQAITTTSRDRVLVDGGIVELPSAGYLPVALGTTTVNEQVRRLVGPGVDLRFCVVRPDFVPHALEEAQHMDRISLLAGLDDPAARPEVDVLVPNGRIDVGSTPSRGGWDTELRVVSSVDFASVAANRTTNADGTLATRVTTGAGVALHGAGRVERLPGGGGAFHFAGAQEVDDDDKITTVLAGARTFVADADRRATIVENAATAAKAARDATPATPAPDAPTTTRVDDDATLRTFTPAPRVNDALVARLAKNAATLRTARAAADTTARVAAADADETPTLSAAADDASSSTAAGWLSVRAEQNLFALGTGASSPVSLDVTIELQGTRQALLRLRMSGSLVVVRPPVQTAAGLAMTGHVSGAYALRTALDDSATPETGGTLELNVSLVRGTDANGRATLKVRFATVARPQIVWDATGTFDDDPAAFRVVLGVGITKAGAAANTATHLTLAALAARASDTALSTGSALRMLSTSALALLGDALTDAGLAGATFVDAATRTLFPPASTTSDLTVRPTLDWVLFHRRRTKQCGAESPRETPAPARKYQLYHVRAKSQAEVATIDRQLRGNLSVEKIGFARVDVVAFAGGLAVLDTPVETLLADWRGANPANTLVYGAIAASTQDDSALLTERLARIASALAPVSPLDDDGQLTTVPNVPTGFAVPGTDGAVFLVTLPAAAPPVVSRVRVAVMGFRGDTPTGRIELRSDVLTFDGDVLRTGADATAVLDLLKALPAPGQRAFVGMRLLTPNAPVATDEAHLKALLTAFQGTTPPIIESARLRTPPTTAAMTTAEQRAMLTEDGVAVDAVAQLDIILNL